MFRRRKREDPAEAAREAERRALFEELAKRPDTVCPFLGLAGARADYHPGVTREHRCYAFGDPAELSAEQQEKVCLQRGYGNCPRYLRGVLVIPTEELEALRRPMAALPQPPPKPTPKPIARPGTELAPAGGGGRRRGLIAGGLALLLVAGGATVILMATHNYPFAVATPTPSPSASIVASGSPGPSVSVTPVPTPVVVSGGPLPTRGPGDQFIGYAIFVAPGHHQVKRLDGDGNITGEATAVFNRISAAPVDLVRDSGGTVYWRTLAGGYDGLAYTKDLSGEYTIYRVYRAPDGSAHFEQLPNNEP
ncbi:MAG: hypothetical protein M3O78_01665 [Chloroflexota bacterium]|nr:hypothetical protein [Chloroflexota bacterium]